MKDKSFVLIILLLCVAGFVSWNLYFKKYLQRDSVDIANFPLKIGSWSAEVLPISETDYAILETRNVFVRRYTNPNGQQVYLFIVYSQNNRKVSHPPEVCYTGGGVTILEQNHDFIPVGPNQMLGVNRLKLSKGDIDQIAYYWFKVGDNFTMSYWKQQILIAVKTFLGKPASSALIRVSADVANENLESTTQLIQDFTKSIFPEILRHLP